MVNRVPAFVNTVGAYHIARRGKQCVPLLLL